MKRILTKALGRGKLTVIAVVAALTLFTASTAFAANGSNFVLGVATNTATAITKLTSNIANPALYLVNNSTSTGATALRLETAAGKPPLVVNRQTKVNNLNSDLVDGWSATSLARVAKAVDDDAALVGEGTVLTTTINAPSSGFLMIDASSDVFNYNESDDVLCFIELDGSRVVSSARELHLDAGAGVNKEEDCSTNTVVPVQGGTHTVDLEADSFLDLTSTTFDESALSVLYVPFDGSGNQPSDFTVLGESEVSGQPEPNNK